MENGRARILNKSASRRQIKLTEKQPGKPLFPQFRLGFRERFLAAVDVALDVRFLNGLFVMANGGLGLARGKEHVGQAAAPEMGKLLGARFGLAGIAVVSQFWRFGPFPPPRFFVN